MHFKLSHLTQQPKNLPEMRGCCGWKIFFVV